MRVKTIYTKNNLDRVVEMRKAGAAKADMMRELGLSRSSVTRLIRKLKADGRLPDTKAAKKEEDVRIHLGKILLGDAVSRMMDAKDILKWVAKKHLTGEMAYLAPEIDSIVKRIVAVAADVQLWTK